jgi:hypothetical protein
MRRPQCGSGFQLVLCTAMSLGIARGINAQQTLPTPPVAPVIPGFHAPAIALASPMEGSVVPQERPVAVFRFNAAEATDPIDALSFAVTVDGQDKTALFQLVGTEAWGQLSAPGHDLSVGPHDVFARICSQRGICSVARATVQATITTAPAGILASGTTNSRGAAGSARGKLNAIDRAVQAAKVLVK